MPTPTTMNRVIHGAVRRDFQRLATALTEVTEGDRRRAQDLRRAFHNLTEQLTHHHEGEDRWIWPMLAKAGVDPELLSTMESEHQTMAQALAETRTAMDLFALDGSAAHAAAARESLQQTQVVVDQHLSHEEEDLEPALMPHLESPEWQQVEKQLSRQPLYVAGPFFAWVTDGMSEAHRQFLRSAVPVPVVFILSRVFGRAYHREIAPIWRSRVADSSAAGSTSSQ